MTDLLYWSGPVSQKQPNQVQWLRPTKIFTNPKTGSENYQAYLELSAKDGFAWAEIARKAKVDPDDVGSFAIAGFSAFHGFANALLQNPEDFERCCAIHAADACFSNAGATDPKKGYLAAALRAATKGDFLFLATTNGPWGQDIHYSGPDGHKYDLTSGARCIENVWNAVVAQVDDASLFYQPPVPPGVPAPDRAMAIGRFVWFHYEGTAHKDPHARHVTELGAPFMQYYLAPWMAERATPADAVDPQRRGGRSKSGENGLLWGAAAMAALAAGYLLAKKRKLIR